MSIMMHLSLIPGADKLINSNPELRDKITKLLFLQKVDFKDYDWDSTSFVVAGDPTTKVWVTNTVKEISDFLPNNAKPGIVYGGGNNGKYKPARWYQILRKLETKFATNICYVNGYELKPFIYGFESEIIHKEVEKQVPDSTFKSVEKETKSTNIHQTMENVLANGYLDNVKNVVIVAGKEYATRCIGTLRATLKSHGLNYTDYNIVAWPYTKNLSVEKSAELRELMGISYKLPAEENNPLIVDENNWYKSALSLYNVVIEINSLIKYAKKGHVLLTDEQKELADYISKHLTKKNMMLETIKLDMSTLIKQKIINPIIQKIKGDKQKG
ncbi:MAG: hypothetical protein IJL05_02605 [Alphaproteobacteria bacterium]|nr:hypothetical protein [Alphaproteobacteria bacterium]